MASTLFSWPRQMENPSEDSLAQKPGNSRSSPAQRPWLTSPLMLAGPSSMILTPPLCRNCQKLGGFRMCAATLPGACCHGPGWVLPRSRVRAATVPGEYCHGPGWVLPRSRVSTATSLCQFSCLQPRLLPRVFVKFSLLVSRLYCILVYLVYILWLLQKKASSIIILGGFSIRLLTPCVGQKCQELFPENMILPHKNWHTATLRWMISALFAHSDSKYRCLTLLCNQHGVVTCSKKSRRKHAKTILRCSALALAAWVSALDVIMATNG